MKLKNHRTVLNQLGNYYLVDLKATKKYYGDLLAYKNLVPIPLTRTIYLFLLK